jgi:hypothetical protein
MRAGYTFHNLDLTFFINTITNNMPALIKYQANGSTDMFIDTAFRPRPIGLTPNLSI